MPASFPRQLRAHRSGAGSGQLLPSFSARALGATWWHSPRTIRVGAGSGLFTRPVVIRSAGRRPGPPPPLFWAADKRVYALDEHGTFWSFETGDNVASRPAIVGDVVVVGSEDRSVYGLDAATGTRRWRNDRRGRVSSPVVAGNLVIIGSDDSRVVALDPANGGIIWSFDGEDAMIAPVVASGTGTLAGFRDGVLVALDPTDGHALWEAKLDSAIETAPWVAEDTAIVADHGGWLYGIDLATGERRDVD